MVEPPTSSLLSMAARGLHHSSNVLGSTMAHIQVPPVQNPRLLFDDVQLDEDLFEPVAFPNKSSLQARVPTVPRSTTSSSNPSDDPAGLHSLLDQALLQIMEDDCDPLLVSRDPFEMHGSTPVGEQTPTVIPPSPPVTASMSVSTEKKRPSSLTLGPSASNGFGRSSSRHTKRQRTSGEGPKFRPYQEQQWVDQFEALKVFKEEHGHCLVPHTYTKNQVLSRWVKRQRYQYKLKQEGSVSTMTDIRVQLLEDVGFVWDSHAAAWEERYNELKRYQSQYGHCNVPSNYPANPQLATWVKCQRRQCKLFCNNRTSNMTMERIQALNQLGFAWKLRRDAVCSSSPLRSAPTKATAATTATSPMASFSNDCVVTAL